MAVVLSIITMKSIGDFAPSRLHQWFPLLSMVSHITPLSMMTRATWMSCARDVREVQSAIGTGL